MIGCCNHKLHLDVLELMGKEEKKSKTGRVAQQADGYQPLIRKVDLLMGELKTLKNSSKLRTKTDLVAIRKNVTRWGSILQMLKRWLQLRGPVSNITQWPESVIEKIPTPSENQDIIFLVEELQKFESCSKILQNGSNQRLNLLDARNLFDGLVEDFGTKYPLSHLRKDSTIIENPDFEKGVVKILDGRENELTRAEEIAVSIFLKDEVGNESVASSPGQNSDYAAMLLRRENRKRPREESKSKYRKLRHISPTSSVCEVLFSKARLIMTHLRKIMSPHTLNMLLFLKANKKLWPNASIVQRILNNRKKNGIADDEEDDNVDAEDSNEDEIEESVF